MTTAKIYKVTCTNAYQMYEQGTSYGLEPWGDNTAYYEGYDDGGVDYILPDGYEVAKSFSGTLEIYDENERHCTLYSCHGKPAIMTNGGKTIVLKRA